MQLVLVTWSISAMVAAALYVAPSGASAQAVKSYSECRTSDNRITLACGSNRCPGGTQFYRKVNEPHPICNPNSTADAFSLPCGGGSLEGKVRNQNPVLWKVEGQPDVAVFQSVGRNPTLLTAIQVCGSGVVSSFQNFNNEGWVTYSPTCRDLRSGGETVVMSNPKEMGITKMTVDPRGGLIIDAFHNHSRGPRLATFYSPDCLNLFGGGRTEVVKPWKKL